MKLRTLITFLGLTLLLGACSQAETTALRIGTNLWLGYEPLYLAQDSGKLGPKVNLIEYPSASQVMQAFRDGQIDAAALTLDEVLLLADAGFEPKIVLAMDVSDGADAIISRPEFKTLRDLKGHRIGVERSALGAYMLHRALGLSGMSPEDIIPVNLQIQQHQAAYHTRQVDAVVTFEPVRSSLIAAGGTELFDSSMIPNEIVDVLVVNKNYLPQHSDVVNSLIEVWFQTLDKINQNPMAAAEAMSTHLKQGPRSVLKALGGLHFPDRSENARLVNPKDGQQPTLQKSAQRLANTMRAEGLLGNAASVQNLFNQGR
jgi:NitT/TauT family transport system substrate-binding protein